MQSYRIALDPAHVPPAPMGSMLLHLQSDSWVPAEEDPTRHEWRSLGVQFGGLDIEE